MLEKTVKAMKTVPETFELKATDLTEHSPSDQTDKPKADKAFAGPIPSADHLIYQPVFPDNDLDLVLQKDSVTCILLTGFIQERTEMSLYLGASLSTFVLYWRPQNDKQANPRRETIGKRHLDLRPANLTPKKPDEDSRFKTKTNYSHPTYAVVDDAENEFCGTW